MLNRAPKYTLMKLLKNGLNSEIFTKPDRQFIEIIQDAIPESTFLKMPCSASVEGNAQQTLKNFHGISMMNEEVRAFSGLIGFKKVINGMQGVDKAYSDFVECQIEMKKPVLTSESFKQIGNFVTAKLKSPESCAAAVWSILCNDLGKIHHVVSEYEKIQEQKTGHDLLLAEILQKKPDLFPGFSSLPETQRNQIIKGYASGCDISQFEQLELPIISLNGLKSLDQETLDLYVLHSIFDVAGAAAHFKSNGSLTMHEETWQFFKACSNALDKLPCGASIDDVYKNYLVYRSQCIGIKYDSKESFALIRIAGIARLATVAQGEMLLEVWNNSPKETKQILIDELTIDGAKDKRPIFIGYGVAMLLNPQGALQSELTAKSKAANTTPTIEQRLDASKKGLKIGLTVMANVFEHTRKAGLEFKPEIFVAECEELAAALNKNPEELINRKFEVITKGERRIDYRFEKSLLVNLGVFANNVDTTLNQSSQKIDAPIPKL